jgi:hypothetical protein
MGVKRGLTLREEHSLRVLENRMLRIQGGPKRIYLFQTDIFNKL